MCGAGRVRSVMAGWSGDSRFSGPARPARIRPDRGHRRRNVPLSRRGYLAMAPDESDDAELLVLSQEFRDALRHSIYLARRLDSDGDLSAAQLGTLKMLQSDGARVGEIARNLGVKVPSATEQIIKLERAGLVRREADPDDSSGVRVRLTAAGGAPSNPPTPAATRSWPASSGPFPQRTGQPSRPPCPSSGRSTRRCTPGPASGLPRRPLHPPCRQDDRKRPCSAEHGR